jgi:hypothetical protein
LFDKSTTINRAHGVVWVGFGRSSFKSNALSGRQTTRGKRKPCPSASHKGKAHFVAALSHSSTASTNTSPRVECPHASRGKVALTSHL